MIEETKCVSLLRRSSKTVRSQEIILTPRLSQESQGYNKYNVCHHLFAEPLTSSQAHHSLVIKQADYILFTYFLAARHVRA